MDTLLLRFVFVVGMVLPSVVSCERGGGNDGTTDPRQGIVVNVDGGVGSKEVIRCLGTPKQIVEKFKNGPTVFRFLENDGTLPPDDRKNFTRTEDYDNLVAYYDYIRKEFFPELHSKYTEHSGTSYGYSVGYGRYIWVSRSRDGRFAIFRIDGRGFSRGFVKRFTIQGVVGCVKGEEEECTKDLGGDAEDLLRNTGEDVERKNAALESVLVTLGVRSKAFGDVVDVKQNGELMEYNLGVSASLVGGMFMAESVELAIKNNSAFTRIDAHVDVNTVEALDRYREYRRTVITPEPSGNPEEPGVGIERP